jgi:hypothetical protein
VNFVWNYCNDIQSTGFKLAGPGETNGCPTAPGRRPPQALRITRVAFPYDPKGLPGIRKISKAEEKALAAIPWPQVSQGAVQHRARLFDGKTFIFRGVPYTTTHLRDTLKPGIKIGAGSFNQDTRGRWYINVPVDVECAGSAPNARVGIDLGLDTLAGLSHGCENRPAEVLPQERGET